MTKINDEVERLRTVVEGLKSETRERRTGIWLEVVEVQLDTGVERLRVQLKGDRAEPTAMWWPVADQSPGSSPGGATGTAAEDQAGKTLDLYKTILGEIDKKRVVLARLTCDEGAEHELGCVAFRFQTAELGSR